MSRKLAGDVPARTRQPFFLVVVTGTGEAAYRRADGVHVIPVRSLGV